MADGWDLGLPDCRASQRSLRKMRFACCSSSSSIDGGNWVLSNECGALGTSSAYQNFAHHQAPTALEAQHSVLYEQRWAETILGHLKELDTVVDAKKKLGGGKGSNKEVADGSTAAPKPKPKAKAKEKGEKGRKGQGSSSQETGGPSQA